MQKCIHESISFFEYRLDEKQEIPLPCLFNKSAGRAREMAGAAYYRTLNKG